MRIAYSLPGTQAQLSEDPAPIYVRSLCEEIPGKGTSYKGCTVEGYVQLLYCHVPWLMLLHSHSMYLCI